MRHVRPGSAQKPFASAVLLQAALLLVIASGCTIPGPKAAPEGRLQSREWVALQVRQGQTLASIAGDVYGHPSRSWIIADFNDVSRARPGQTLLLPMRPYQKGGLRPEGFQTVPVLVYHKFSLSRSDPMTVRQDDFEQQMALLKREGYRVIPLKMLFDFLSYEVQIPERAVVITIDDGWRSTYDIAFPVLQKYGYPATLFLYTDLVTGSTITLGWDQLREMHEKGLDIQCHTKSHRDLNMIMSHESYRDYFLAVKDELEHSTRTIRERLGFTPEVLAYPYGETNNLVIALLEKMGYQGGLTVERGTNPFDRHPFRLKRSMIYGSFDLSDFKDNLTTFQPFPRPALAGSAGEKAE